MSKERQIHFGKEFYKDHTAGYWISIDCPKIRAHQWVWKNNHGDIPKGYHIHHRNGDKSDNRIENLELVEASRHIRDHMQKRMKDPLYKKKAQENCERIRPMTKAWHASPEGIAWHKLHAIKCNFGNGDPIKYICEICSKEYLSKVKAKGRTRFCSNNCKSAFRRKSGKDEIDKICSRCNVTFSCNKYSMRKNCLQCSKFKQRV